MAGIFLMTLCVFLGVCTMDHRLSIASFNTRGIMPNAAYIEGVLAQHDIDILGLCEHWLYPTSLDFVSSMCIGYTAVSKADTTLDPSSTWRRGKGGVAILWKKQLRVTAIPIDSDRIAGVCVKQSKNCQVYIFMVYLPSAPNEDLFSECVSLLEDLYNQYQELGTVIFIGDWNCEVTGARYTARNSRREARLGCFLKDLTLSSLSVRADCVGPDYSFDAGVGRSLIDHIIIPSDLNDVVTSCIIVDKTADMDGPRNYSDHLVVIGVLDTGKLDCAVTSTTSCDEASQPRVDWKNANISQLADYSLALAVLLPDIGPLNAETCVCQDVDKYMAALTTCIHEAASITLPISTFSKFKKPYWKRGVNAKHKLMKTARKSWLNAGKPRGRECETYAAYKDSKREFRCTQRRAVAQEEVTAFENLDVLAGNNINKFWRALKKLRQNKTGTSDQAGMMFEGKMTREPGEIADGWANYFADLYTPKQCGEFDDNFRQCIEDRVKRYPNRSLQNHTETLDAPITLGELLCEIRTLKPGKAGGVDGLVNEHIKKGGAALHTQLHYLLLAMQRLEYTPPQLKTGLVVTLQKDRNRAASDPGNYRGITLLSVILKLYEKIILRRLQKWTDETEVAFPDELQNAYRSGVSCLNLSMCLQECINYSLERGSKIYCCLLDTSKAFDVVWHNGLFAKLFQHGVNGKLWRIMHQMYKDVTSRVLHKGILSKTFCVQQSVRQGGVLSPWLYVLYIDGLIKELRDSQLGLHLDHLFCGVVVQADDVALLSLSLNELQKMVDICHGYSLRWRYKINSLKTKWMVFGESATECRILRPLRQLRLGDQTIDEKSENKHVGILLNACFDSTQRTDNACQKMRGSFMGLAGAGVRPKGLNPLTSIKLFKLIVLPTALYGCELWCGLPDRQLLKLDRTQRFCLKVAQDLGIRTRTDMCHSLVAMPRLGSFVDRAKLLFLGRLCNTHDEQISKKVFLRRMFQLRLLPNHTGMHCSITMDLVRVAQEYELDAILDEYLVHGVFPSRAAWSNMVTDAIVQAGRDAFHDRTIADPDFGRFLIVHPDCFSACVAWIAAGMIPGSLDKFVLLVRLLVYPLGNWAGTMLCEFCGATYNDPLVHHLTLCPLHQAARDKFWDFLVNCCPLEVSVALHNMCEETLVASILGAPLEIDNRVFTDEMYYVFLYRCALYVFTLKDYLHLTY